MVTELLINELVSGNKRFVNGKSQQDAAIARAKNLSEKQNPQIAIICCADSRVVPEIIFDQPLGTFLCARVPGNISTPETLATVELALLEFKAALVIVLGHTKCAAVGAMCSGSALTGYLGPIIKKIEPAKALVENSSKNCSDNLSFVDNVSRENAVLNAANLKEQSSIVREHCSKEQTKIVGGIYNVQTGLVDFF